ncbi:MAG: ribonuclease R [Gammaproteobacteria bacterium RBG_16_57_12]|nr:MAG: ribonuclease R [Gammaproteobacteria bacterium RBG_16_57_12]
MTKQKSPQDPHAEREAGKYEKPIPSREHIMAVLHHQGVPLNFNKLAKALNLYEENDLDALQRRLNAMERDGQVLRNRRNGYGLMDKMDLVRGRVVGHSDGFGFLIPDEGGEDLFLSFKEMRGVLHGDRVAARVTGTDRRGRKEGAVIEVLERHNHQVVGRFALEGGIGFVVPDNKRINQDILIPPDKYRGASPGQFVVADIIEQPTRYRQPIAAISEVLGDHMAPGMEIDVAIRTYELPHEWPQDLLEEIKAFSHEVPEQAKQGREDIRSLPLVTIDGEDARDFDDAVYCEPHGKGWRLLVAIADVSAYVAPATALDQEAIKRGNSVYFPERVIPMLPEVLSNGLCSLNPHVDRLCMVCELIITPQGAVRSYRFFEGVMRSHARLTYNQVAAMLVDKDAQLRGRHHHLVPHLEELYALYQVFAARRGKRGAIEFETTETYIQFDDARKIKAIVPRVRNDAHRIIEECMVTANVAAADFLLDKKMPALYRVHDGPSEDKLTDLRAFLAELGLSLAGGDKPEATHYAKLLASIKGRPDFHLIQTVLLRSLKQAVYSPDNIGHFGLAYEAYAHFTSPIRRYPDLLVHRAIRHLIRGKSVERFDYSFGDMQSHGEHCSMTERRADEATRDAVDWLKCEFMRDKVGEAFDGIVTGVTGFGLFVELKDIYVEGLVHITALKNDYYHFDPAKHRLLGERTSTVYRLADPLRVQVMRVDLDDRKIDFELVDHPMGDQPVRPAKSARSGKPAGAAKGNRGDKSARPDKTGTSSKKATSRKQDKSGKSQKSGGGRRSRKAKPKQR